MNAKQMRARAIRVLILVSLLSTFTPWYVATGEATVGTATAPGRLVALATGAALVMHLVGMRAGWIGVGFAAFVMWSELFAATGLANTSPGWGLIAGTLIVTVAAVLMIWEMVDALAAVKAARAGSAK